NLLHPGGGRQTGGRGAQGGDGEPTSQGDAEDPEGQGRADGSRGGDPEGQQRTK
ncbi:hypothetical protein M9458_000244, partial [Cirrhinus mrigala]